MGFSPSEIFAQRKIYNVQVLFNSFSYALVTGNVITMYALFLGADSSMIGLVTSFSFLSYFAMPLGMLSCRRFSVMTVFRWTWLFRKLSLLPMLAIPFFLASGRREFGLLTILFGTFLFHFWRGIGMIANNPTISELAPGNDRGSYMMKLSILNNAAALLATLFITLLLLRFPSAIAYNVSMIFAVVTGFVSVWLLFRMKDFGTPKRGGRGGDFHTLILKAIHDKNFVGYSASLFVVAFGIGMARPFVIVFCKNAYGLSDGIVGIISLFSTLGAVLMGVATRIFIDKLGPKPVYQAFAALSAIFLLPAVLAPHFRVAGVEIAFLCLFAMLVNFAFVGQENAAQTYFFAIVQPDALLQMSVVYYFILGVTGAAGSIFGGALIDGLSNSGISEKAAFRLFYGGMALVILAGFLLLRRLKNVGTSYSLSRALPIFFSARDIRALSLIYRLDRADDADSQEAILSELAESSSTTAEDEIISLMKSPQCSVRIKAMDAVSSLPSLSDRIADVLIAELRKGKYTSAAQAARILGKFAVKKASPSLRDCIESDDYMLSADAILSLARIGDEKTLEFCDKITTDCDNPHILLWAVRAIRRYDDFTAIPILQKILREKHDVYSVENEILLTMAQILGIHKEFYKAFCEYCEGHEPTMLLQSFFERSCAKHRSAKKKMPESFCRFCTDADVLVEFADDVSKSISDTTLAGRFLLDGTVDADLSRQPAYRFFVAFYASFVLSGGKIRGGETGENPKAAKR